MKRIRHTTSTVTGVIAALLSSSGLAAALSGIGIIAGPPLAGLPALFGSILTAFTVKSKKLNSKITVHEKTISIGKAKYLSVSSLFSKAMKDGSISDVEFDLILSEIEQYHLLKNQLRRKANEIDVHAFEKQIKE